MEEAAFNALVERLEQRSRVRPRRYKAEVGLLAGLGFGLLLLIVLVSGLGILAIGAAAVWLALSGAKAILLVVKFGKLLLLIAAPLWLLLRSSVSALFTPFPRPTGREISRGEAPDLFLALDHMRQRMGGPRFHHVLLTNDMNAAVVQRPLLGLLGFPRNYLLLGLPLLESLSPPEALAVVAHEYGHLSGAHARFSAFIYRLRNSWSSIQSLAQQWKGVGAGLLQRLIGWYAPFFNAYTYALARANEFDADAASAELVGASTAANALKRVNVAAARHDEFLSAVYARSRVDSDPPSDLAEQWAASASRAAAAADASRWLSSSLARRQAAFDTHPPLLARLAALPGEAERATELPPPLHSPSAAQSWLGTALAALRTAQQVAWQREVSGAWRKRFEEVSAQRARLGQLVAIESPSAEEALERLQLEVAVEPAADHVAKVAAFNAAHPDRAVGLYLEGSLRLERDDESAVALLERVMALDNDAIKPACALLHAYYMRHGRAEEAELVAQRWRARHSFEMTRAQQLHTLDPTHALTAAALDEAAMTTVRELLGKHSAGIRRAYLARRVLPADPSIRTYVVGVDLTWWARLRSQSSLIVKRLAAQPWPFHVFVVPLRSQPSFAKRLRAIAGSEVFRAS